MDLFSMAFARGGDDAMARDLISKWCRTYVAEHRPTADILGTVTPRYVRVGMRRVCGWPMIARPTT